MSVCVCVCCARVCVCFQLLHKEVVYSLLCILKHFLFGALSSVCSVWYVSLAESGCVVCRPVFVYVCVCVCVLCTLSSVHLKSAGVVTAHLECHGETLADPEDSCSASGPPLIICLAASVMTAHRPLGLRVLQPRDGMWKPRVCYQNHSVLP